jgi:hypothetical protein
MCNVFAQIFLCKQWSSIRAQVYIAQIRTEIIFNNSTFWDIMLLTPVRNSALWFASCLIIVSCLAYFSTLKMEMTLFSEISVDFCWTTLRYNSENINLHNELCENLRSHIKLDSLYADFMINNTIENYWVVSKRLMTWALPIVPSYMNVSQRTAYKLITKLLQHCITIIFVVCNFLLDSSSTAGFALSLHGELH